MNENEERQCTMKSTFLKSWEEVARGIAYQMLSVGQKGNMNVSNVYMLLFFKRYCD